MTEALPDSQFATFRFLLKERRDFRRLFLSNVVSLLGDWLSYIAVSLVALHEGEGALAIALVYVAHSLPPALIAPISGPVADRFDRKAVLIFSYVGAAAMTLLMLATASAGWVLALQGCLLVRGCISGLGITARTASVPMLVKPHELHGANALLGLTWSIMFTTGVALGGLASAVLSPVDAIALDAATFLVAAAIAATLPKLPPSEGQTAPRLGIRELVRAWAKIRPLPGATYSLLAKTPPAMANAGGWVALNLLALQSLPKLSLPIALGLLQGIRAIGTGIGPLVPDKVFPRRSHIASPFVFVGILVFAYAYSPWVAGLGLLLWGMGTGHNFVNSVAELQTVVPGGMLGRVVALDFCFFCSSQALLAVVSALLGDLTGDPKDCALFAVIVGLVAWICAQCLRPRTPTG